MLLDPLGDLGQVLVLLADVVLLAKVDEEDDGLGCEEEERVDDLDLVVVPTTVSIWGFPRHGWFGFGHVCINRPKVRLDVFSLSALR